MSLLETDSVQQVPADGWRAIRRPIITMEKLPLTFHEIGTRIKFTQMEYFDIYLICIKYAFAIKSCVSTSH